MKLAEVLNRIAEQKLLLRPTGFFNVEGGDAAVATKYFDWCDSCMEFLGPVFAPCPDCGRTPGEFLRIPAGDGDGVYVVFELYSPENPQSGLGGLVIFDNKYEIADSVRDPILEERLPAAPTNLFLKRGTATLTTLGSMASSDKILISDGFAGKDSKYATVDVLLEKPEPLIAFAFTERVSADINVEATRLEVEAGMERSAVLGMLESLIETSHALSDPPKGYGSLPEISFRGLLILPEQLSKSLGLDAIQIELDWESLTGQFMGKICTSHTQTMEAAAVWFNVLLHREIDRAAGDVSSEDGKRLLFNMWSWVYQGIHNLDDDCRQLLNNSYVPTKDEVSELLERRGLVEAAESFRISGKIGGHTIPVVSGSSNSHPERKSSIATSSASTPTTLAKFCGSCGTKFERDSDKFCSECGEPR